MSEPVPVLPEPVLVQRALTFEWRDEGGASWQADPIRLGHVTVSTHLTYVIRILREGNQVGVARRRVGSNQADGLHVEHITLQITDDRARGRGFPTAYWLASLDRYRLLGLHRVMLLADDQGRTFWAREPVRFRDGSQPRAMLAAWTKPSCLSPADVASIARVETNPDSFTPADLYANPVGRMLLEAQSWKGVVDL